MLNEAIQNTIDAAKKFGWVMEPDAKHLLDTAGLTVPCFKACADFETAAAWAREIGFPVATKVVSPDVMHKSDVGGVAVGLENETELRTVYDRYAKLPGFTGMLVEPMASGVELIIGAKVDHQFGPIILLGIGGTGVEIYQDTAIRMAPLCERDVLSMAGSLKARVLLEGYRGDPGVNMGVLAETLIAFSDLVMNLGDRFESIDLNPVMCSPTDCVVADARIVLAGI
jgi:acetate---CoA ligase (ADP-forming) subunit beta